MRSEMRLILILMMFWLLEQITSAVAGKRKSIITTLFLIAVAMIGSMYGKNLGKSNYHNGITYIASELGITKRQVKVLRKKMKHRNGFSFKTPYNISTTLKKIIDLLKNKEQDPDVKEFLSQQESKMYREFLIGKQFEAIKEAAKKGKREKVKNVADELKEITIKVGE